MKKIIGLSMLGIAALGGVIYYFFFKKKVLPTASTTTAEPVINSPVITAPALTVKQADAIANNILKNQNGYYGAMKAFTWGTENETSKILKKQLTDNGYELASGCPPELDGRCVSAYPYVKITKQLNAIEAEALFNKIKIEEKWVNGKQTGPVNNGSELRSQLYRGGWKIDPLTFVVVKI